MQRKAKHTCRVEYLMFAEMRSHQCWYVAWHHVKVVFGVSTDISTIFSQIRNHPTWGGIRPEKFHGFWSGRILLVFCCAMWTVTQTVSTWDGVMLSVTNWDVLLFNVLNTNWGVGKEKKKSHHRVSHKLSPCPLLGFPPSYPGTNEEMTGLLCQDTAANCSGDTRQSNGSRYA